MADDLLTFEDLRQQTENAVREAPQTQSALANELGVHRSSVSRAIHQAGPHFWKLQKRIIEHLTSVCIERQIRFQMSDTH